MARIPAGSFEMGLYSGEPGNFSRGDDPDYGLIDHHPWRSP